MRDELKKGAGYCILVDYEADALGTPDKKDPSRSIQDTVFDAIKYVNFAIWLAQRAGFGFFCVIHGHETNHEWLFRQLFEVQSTCPLPAYQHNQLDTSDFLKASELFSVLQALRPSLRMTADAAAVALTQKDFPLRFLIFWLVIESLFGPEDAREITFRLSQHVALFLGENPPEAREIFEKVKLSYRWRSKLVHGIRLSKLTKEKSSELINDLEDIVWRSLRKTFGDTELMKRFETRERETFLDDLAFE